MFSFFSCSWTDFFQGSYKRHSSTTKFYRFQQRSHMCHWTVEGVRRRHSGKCQYPREFDWCHYRIQRAPILQYDRYGYCGHFLQVWLFRPSLWGGSIWSEFQAIHTTERADLAMRKFYPKIIRYGCIRHFRFHLYQASSRYEWASRSKKSCYTNSTRFRFQKRTTMSEKSRPRNIFQMHPSLLTWSSASPEIQQLGPLERPRLSLISRQRNQCGFLTFLHVSPNILQRQVSRNGGSWDGPSGTLL